MISRRQLFTAAGLVAAPAVARGAPPVTGMEVQDAIDQTYASGGGTVVTPPGPLVVEQSLIPRSNVHIKAPGYLATTLIRGPDCYHVFDSAGEKQRGIHISDFRIYGAWDTAPFGVHGLRLGECDDSLLERLLISHCSGYGIGLQEAPYRWVTIRDVRILWTGGDGLDIKNQGSMNHGVILDGITVYAYGQELHGQAGIDVRGRTRLDNIWVNTADRGQVCVRFRTDGPLNGRGAQGSMMSNYYLRSTGGRHIVEERSAYRRVSYGAGVVK